MIFINMVKLPNRKRRFVTFKNQGTQIQNYILVVSKCMLSLFRPSFEVVREGRIFAIIYRLNSINKCHWSYWNSITVLNAERYSYKQHVLFSNKFFHIHKFLIDGDSP